VSEDETGKARLESAVKSFLENVGAGESLLWSMSYRVGTPAGDDSEQKTMPRVSTLPPRAFDVALDDAILVDVKQAWEKVLGPEGGAKSTFLRFEERENEVED
jgi:Rab proteins geranylgeranyltransferase component A